MDDDKKGRLSEAIKNAGLLALGGFLTSKLDGSSNAPRDKKLGCLGCLGILLVVGLFAMMLERIGCMATDKSLREKVHVVIGDVHVQEDKKLAWVHFKVQNQSNWSVSLGVSLEVFQTTKDYPVARNSVEVLNVSSKSESGEQRIAFDLDELTRAGIVDVADKDLCSIRQRIEWISQAGDEVRERNR